MTEPRVPLYERLPEIYRIKDEEQDPPGQLRHYLALVEDVYSDIHANIEALYHDLFIDTCEDWVIPYIGDLLGVSHLKGEPWTLRADVADTIALRRRKGTLGSIERLVYNLTRWGVHCRELRESLVWSQHLNHQRPDVGGDPPYSLPSVTRFTPIRGGTVTLREPAMLSLLDTPFDPFAHVPDVKPPSVGAIRYNLPNLAIFLWRLEDYRVPAAQPLFAGSAQVGATDVYAVRFSVDPLGRPVRLFNTYQFDPDVQPPVVTEADRTPSPIPRARLNEASESGRPECYVTVNTYDPSGEGPELADVGLQLHLPAEQFEGREWPTSDPDLDSWRVRGGNLCGWEEALATPLQLEYDLRLMSVDTTDELEDEGRSLVIIALVGNDLYIRIFDISGVVVVDKAEHELLSVETEADLATLKQRLDPFHDESGLRREEIEEFIRSAISIVGYTFQLGEILIDPDIGRIVIGVAAEEVAALQHNLRVSYTYGAVGPVGAHPTDRTPTPSPWDEDTAETREVRHHGTTPLTLNDALHEIDEAAGPVIVEIQDSLIHDLDLSAIDDADPEDGGPNLRLNTPLLVRAASGQRPIIRFNQPLRCRPVDPAEADGLVLRLEGLYLTRSDDEVDYPLIARAALDRLEIINCTLNPGGHRILDGTAEGARSPIRDSLLLHESFGFSDPQEANAFNQTPNIIIQHSITGPLLIDRSYRLSLTHSIVDAGSGVEATRNAPYTLDVHGDMAFAVSAATDPAEGRGPPTQADRATFLGPMRVESIDARGAIWTRTLEVLNNQIGCIKYSYLAGVADRLPQHHACVFGSDARLRFTSEIFGDPAYGQLALSSDFRIRERGLGDDAMGAFGFLLEAHKWRNLQIRFREFMSVGVRPLLIPVT